MNRNTSEHFGHVPKIHQQRSKFDRSSSLKTTFNNGDLVPIYAEEILPGDTVEMDMAEVVRMATPIYPVMDNMVMDLYWFFVPNRLVWDHWAEFWGENNDEWMQTTEYEIPQINAPEGGWKEGTIADYMGIPTNKDGFSVSALPFRAYAKIWSDWFRDENLKKAAHMYTDETTRNGSNGSDYVLDVEFGGMPAKGAKMADYFTTALPSPQKGPAVAIPLGTSANVYTGETHELNKPGTRNYGMNWGAYNANTMERVTFGSNGTRDMTLMTESATGGGWPTVETYIKTSSSTRGDTTNVVAPANLYADLSNATAATISQLRTAFAIQKYYEAAGRFGR